MSKVETRLRILIQNLKQCIVGTEGKEPKKYLDLIDKM